MDILWDVTPALLAALGLLGAGWVLLGWLLRCGTRYRCWLLIPGRGEGEHLEQELRRVMWLREMGLLSCTVAIADVSLSREGRELAMRLILRWPDVVLWPVNELGELARMYDT